MKPTPVSKTDIVFEEGQFGGKTPFKSAVLDSVQEMPIPTDESIFASQFVEGPTSQTDLPALDQALIRTGLYDKATIAEDFTNIPKLATEPKMPVDVGSNVDPYNTDAQLANNQGMLSNLLPEGVAKLLPDLSMTELGIGALGLAALSGLSEQDQMAISRAESSGIFDQTTSQYDFVKMRGEANQRGMTLTQFLGSPFFRNDQSKYYLNDTMMAARGGIMDAPGYVNGPGNGRDDVINARLSNGEYVIDAESVAMLGDGSNTAGAEMLDDMRKKLRMHKGKVLAKGEFSPDAKSPLEYMRRSA